MLAANWIPRGADLSRAAIAAASLLAIAGGCGGFPEASVAGRVTCNGQAVPAGMVTFYPSAETLTPERGWSGRAYVQEDGTYDAELFAGRWRAVFEPPDVSDLEQEAEGIGDEAEEALQELTLARPAAAMPCRMPAEQEIELIKGQNTVNFELPPTAGAGD
jgi:hypothetical protein